VLAVASRVHSILRTVNVKFDFGSSVTNKFITKPTSVDVLTPKLVPAWFSKTSINFCKNTQHHILTGSSSISPSNENIKSLILSSTE